MSRTCAKCGASLLGKVNRCWKCGTAAEDAAVAQPAERFPTIRPNARLHGANASSEPVHVIEDEPPLAIPVEANDASTAEGGEVDSTAVETAPSTAGVERPSEPQRFGSPFASGPSRTAAANEDASASKPGPRKVPEAPSVVLERTARQQVSRAGAYGVWALAALALGGAFFTSIGAALVALLGLTFGLWGLYSDRKAAALGGAALCLALFLFCGFYAATDLYIHAFGRSPWTPAPAPSIGP